MQYTVKKIVKQVCHPECLTQTNLCLWWESFPISVMIKYIRIKAIFRSFLTGRGSSPRKVKKNVQMFWQETSLLTFSAFLLSSRYKSINLTFEEIKKKGGLERAMSVSLILLSTNVPLRLLNYPANTIILFYITVQTLGKKLGSLQTFSQQSRSSLPHKQIVYESVVQCKSAAHGIEVSQFNAHATFCIPVFSLEKGFYFVEEVLFCLIFPITLMHLIIFRHTGRLVCDHAQYDGLVQRFFYSVHSTGWDMKPYGLKRPWQTQWDRPFKVH